MEIFAPKFCPFISRLLQQTTPALGQSKNLHFQREDPQATRERETRQIIIDRLVPMAQADLHNLDLHLPVHLNSALLNWLNFFPWMRVFLGDSQRASLVSTGLVSKYSASQRRLQSQLSGFFPKCLMVIYCCCFFHRMLE